ncbi:MAG TPA: hypothetical protein VK735_49890 [Pseudonocardia sp.]|uniref:hypothetical protein n=1 Tax=Pseudonocardia sp. TaxID=60912 RepID=UPI002C2BF2EB|nr:hypothetical protein [Pseudonocardia sp.]HTF55611.1 hypothetical protein [Pseudonocardia sp.]
MNELTPRSAEQDAAVRHDELSPANLTSGELASIGLTSDDLTPELLAALEETRQLLAVAQLPEPPAHLVRRWHAALDELPMPVATDPSRRSDDQRWRPRARRLAGRRSVRWGGALLAMAAAVVALALPGVAVGPAVPPEHAPFPATPGAPTVQALTSKDLPVGGQDYGPLADPARRAGCLARAGATGLSVLGARQVNWSGRPAVLLVLPTEVLGQLRMLVVSPDCGPDRAEVLADLPVGR